MDGREGGTHAAAIITSRYLARCHLQQVLRVPLIALLHIGRNNKCEEIGMGGRAVRAQ